MKALGQLFIIAGLLVLLNAIYVATFKYDFSAVKSAPQMTQLYTESLTSAVIAIGLMLFGYLVLVIRHEWSDEAKNAND